MSREQIGNKTELFREIDSAPLEECGYENIDGPLYGSDRWYSEAEYPWLAELNRDLKTPEGIDKWIEFLEDQSIAELIITALGTERADENYSKGLPKELDNEVRDEARSALELAKTIGAGQLLIVLGDRLDKPISIKAYDCGFICTMVVYRSIKVAQIPREGGRCLPFDDEA